MNSTTSVQNLQNKLMDGFWNALELAIDFFFSLIIDNFLSLILVIFIILLLSFADAIITGNWGNLGSILYRIIYSVFVILIILIWGIEAIFSNVYSIVSALVLSPLSFKIVGYILRKLGFRQ